MKSRIYYLSEMNVSERHGGGLTLLRILQDDLDKFDNFIQLTEPKFPTIDRYKHREVHIYKGNKVSKPLSRFSKEYLTIKFNRMMNRPLLKRSTTLMLTQLQQRIEAEVEFENSKVLVVPQYFYSIYIINHLKEKYNMRYYAWVMDDHLLSYNPSDGYSYNKPPDYESSFGLFLSKADGIFVISENMKAFYKDRFNVNSNVLFSPSDTDIIPVLKETQNGMIRLCYFGAVWEWTQDAIEKLGAILPKLNAKLDIYSFHEINDKISSRSDVSVQKPVKADEVKKIMAGYDGVIVPYGFNDKVRGLSELNISTKLSECLASGIPTVLVGPEYGAMTKFARQYDCAIVLSDLDDEAQIMNFKKSFQPEVKQKLIRNALQVARDVTSTEAMRNVWRQVWGE